MIGPALNYGKLGLSKNPFPSLGVCPENGLLDDPDPKYFGDELERLRATVSRSVTQSPERGVIYVVGRPGSGKSTLFHLFEKTQKSTRYFALRCRFPFFGGISAFCRELLIRTHNILRAVNWKEVPLNLRASSFVSSIMDLLGSDLDLADQVRIGPYNALRSVINLLEIILYENDASKLVILIDDFEHVWRHMTKMQRSSWEYYFVKMLQALPNRLTFVLPVDATQIGLVISHDCYFSGPALTELAFARVASFNEPYIVRLKESTESVSGLVNRRIMKFTEGRPARTLSYVDRFSLTSAPLAVTLVDLHDHFRLEALRSS